MWIGISLFYVSLCSRGLNDVVSEVINTSLGLLMPVTRIASEKFSAMVAGIC